MNTWLLRKQIRPLSIYEIGWNMIAYMMHTSNFKMDAMELAVEAKLLNGSSHYGHFIPVTTPHVARLWSLVKSCFLPVYRLLI